tara:strand:- start:201 stop:560 length:360 start_codon:yes stop_codon:yes gene_type:complete
MTEEKEMWTIEELVAMTEEVQHKEVVWAGKTLAIQWCELTESEEPKMALPDDEAPQEEQTEYYKQMAAQRVLAMIEKANEKSPDTAMITGENYMSLPTTLRWQMSSLVLGQTNENFISG